MNMPHAPDRPAPPSLRPDQPPKPAPVHGPWRFATVLAAPHRLGFALAMTVLIAASLWWLAVQVDRLTGAFGLTPAISPTLAHATVMVLGFMPLFFLGFLFTAGPNWLHVPPLPATRLLWPLGLQAGGWLLWLTGAQLNNLVALIGLLLAAVGLGWMYRLFWRLIHASDMPDRIHAKAVGVAGVVGTLCVLAIAGALVAGQVDLALVIVRTALWGFIVVTFVAVAHRMIPFFTSNAVPMVAVWRPFWVLWMMLGAAVFEVLAVWVDWASPPGPSWPAWTVLCAVVEAVIGAVMLWLAVVWGLVQSLKIRLLAMLHVGFVWLGLALLLSALSQVLWLVTGQPVLGLGALHALAMGFCGSLMLAMVTRVSCGHSGRGLVADNLVWALFWLLQLAVLVRIAAAVQGASPVWVLAAAALWAVVMTAWGLRYGDWYGRPRIDGKPG